jgi:hypothetical protein
MLFVAVKTCSVFEPITHMTFLSFSQRSSETHVLSNTVFLSLLIHFFLIEICLLCLSVEFAERWPSHQAITLYVASPVRPFSCRCCCFTFPYALPSPAVHFLWFHSWLPCYLHYRAISIPAGVMNMSNTGVTTRSGQHRRPVVEGEDDVEPWRMRLTSTSTVTEDEDNSAFVQVHCHHLSFLLTVS